MKILRAIGAFFAKIGRWIANTAWVQPLLIVGGIFAIIFSIPYIKKAIEDGQVDNTDYNYAYYQDRALGLAEGGKADKLLGYLEDFENSKESIKSEFGTQFMLAFVQKNCQNCKDGVAGFKNVAKKSFENKFKLYTILVDKTDDEGEYLAKELIRKHEVLFDDLAGAYGDNTEDYPLYINKPSIKSSYSDKIKNFAEATLDTGEGFETPTLFMIDVEKEAEWSTNGITEIVFNYIDLIDSSETINEVTKGNLLRDMWTYNDIFDPEYSK